MSMKSVTFSAAWASLARPGKRSERLVGEQGVCFDALYRQYYAPLFAFLHFLAGSPEVAEDLASLVFEKAWAHLADIREQDMAGPWLFRVARNCATDYFRRCKPVISLESLLPEQHPQAAPLEEVALAREEERRLLTHLRLLSEREREVVGLKFAVGMTNREIARLLEMPEGTVGSLLHRALRRLRAALNEEGGLREL